MIHPHYVYTQIRGKAFAGPKADEFILKTQQAAAGPPWYMDSPSFVCPSSSLLVSCTRLVLIIVTENFALQSLVN